MSVCQVLNQSRWPNLQIISRAVSWAGQFTDGNLNSLRMDQNVFLFIFLACSQIISPCVIYYLTIRRKFVVFFYVLKYQGKKNWSTFPGDVSRIHSHGLWLSLFFPSSFPDMTFDISPTHSNFLSRKKHTKVRTTISLEKPPSSDFAQPPQAPSHPYIFWSLSTSMSVNS